MADSRRNGRLEGAACSLDDEVLWPILERVRSGSITVTKDDCHREWYFDDGRLCGFTSHLLERLVEQQVLRWDSMVGEPTKLRVRQDGKWAVRLDYKGEEMLKRLAAERVLGGERAACTSSPACGLVALCHRCGWTTKC